MKFEKRFLQTVFMNWSLFPSLSLSNDCVKNIPGFLVEQYVDTNLGAEDKFFIPRYFLQNNFLTLNDFSNASQIKFIFDSYKPLRSSVFVNFFQQQDVDIPTCFWKSKSTRRLSFELIFLKFSNFLMNRGKKEKTFLILMKALFFVYKTFKDNNNLQTNPDIAKWGFLFFAFNSSLIKKSHSFFTFLNFKKSTTNHNIKKGVRKTPPVQGLFSFSSQYIFFIQPLFYFFLYSLDKRAKKKKKNSNYVFIWKYIPSYKRKALLLKLIAREVKFNSGRTITNRLASTLTELYKHPATNQVFKSTKFAHHHVFKHLRKSLLTNFKTSS